MRENKIENLIREKQKKILIMEKEIIKRKNKREEIQNLFNFDIPLYILDEIIEHKNEKDYKNLNMLIGIAVKAGSLSKENAIKIKEYEKNP